MLAEHFPNIDFFFAQIWLSSFVNELKNSCGKNYKKVLAVFGPKYYIHFYYGEKDSLAFARIINIPTRGIGATTLRKLEEMSVKNNNSLWETVVELVENPEKYSDFKLSARIKSALDEFVHLIQEAKYWDKNGVTPSKVYEKILHSSGYLEHLKTQKDYESQNRIENLDELPIPAWDKYDLNLYHDFHVFDMAIPYTSIMASRGCPFCCTYCISHKLWGNKYRRRSPQHVMAEIDYLVNKMGIQYLTFQDDIWSWQDDNWAREICKQLIERKYKLKWRSILHPLSFLRSRREILPLMKAAGCSSISTGLQSASQKILQHIKRSPQEPEALADLIDIMKKNKIINNTAFIFGLPGETDETIEESIRYAIRIKPTFAAFYALSVLPGSEIWEMEKEGKFNKLPDDYLRMKCREAAKRFFTNPFVIGNLLKSVIQSNPKWIFRGISHLKYLSEIAGMSKSL